MNKQDYLLIDRVGRFLREEMVTEEIVEFKADLLKDPLLQEELVQQKDLLDAMGDLTVEGKRNDRKWNYTRFITLIAILLLLLTTAYIIKNLIFFDIEEEPFDYVMNDSLTAPSQAASRYSNAIHEREIDSIKGEIAEISNQLQQISEKLYRANDTLGPGYRPESSGSMLSLRDYEQVFKSRIDSLSFDTKRRTDSLKALLSAYDSIANVKVSAERLERASKVTISQSREERLQNRIVIGTIAFTLLMLICLLGYNFYIHFRWNSK